MGTCFVGCDCGGSPGWGMRRAPVETLAAALLAEVSRAKRRTLRALGAVDAVGDAVATMGNGTVSVVATPELRIAVCAMTRAVRRVSERVTTARVAADWVATVGTAAMNAGLSAAVVEEAAPIRVRAAAVQTVALVEQDGWVAVAQALTDVDAAMRVVRNAAARVELAARMAALTSARGAAWLADTAETVGAEAARATRRLGAALCAVRAASVMAVAARSEWTSARGGVRLGKRVRA